MYDDSFSFRAAAILGRDDQERLVRVVRSWDRSGGSPEPPEVAEARGRLVLSFGRMIFRVARYYYERNRHRVEFADLVSEAAVGATRGVESFDPDFVGPRGKARMSTYMNRCISDHIKKFLWRELAGGARVTNRDRHHAWAYVKGCGVFPPTRELVESVCGTTGGRTDAVIDAITACRMHAPFSVGTAHEGDAGPDAEHDPCGDPPSADEVAGNEDTIEFLFKFLDGRERELLRLRFGLGGTRAMTLEEVGRELNITRERVRQIQNRAIKKCQARGAALGRTG